MIYRVAHQVRERFSERIENALVEISLFSCDLQSHLLAANLGNIAYHSGKTTEELLNRHHPDFHNGFLQITQDAILKCHGIREFGSQRILPKTFLELVHVLHQHRFADH